MKRLLLLLLIALGAVVANAQNNYVATLSHDKTVTAYYGVTALQQAYAAAADGDLIVLSPGQFGAVNIAKGVTIRGAGMFVDNVTNNIPTVIYGDFSISAPADSTKRLTFEGIYHDGIVTYGKDIHDAQLVKCRFATFKADTAAESCSFDILHCRFATQFALAKNSTAHGINSFFYDPVCNSTTDSRFLFENCVMSIYNTQTGGQRLFNSLFYNCILKPTSVTYVSDCLPSSNFLTKSLIYSGSTYMKKITNGSSYWTTGTSPFSPDVTYKQSDLYQFTLTDAAKTQYLGTDDTEIGMHGGGTPYNPIPTSARIAKLKVAPQSDAEGKLSVEVHLTTDK